MRQKLIVQEDCTTSKQNKLNKDQEVHPGISTRLSPSQHPHHIQQTKNQTTNKVQLGDKQSQFKSPLVFLISFKSYNNNLNLKASQMSSQISKALDSHVYINSPGCTHAPKHLFQPLLSGEIHNLFFLHGLNILFFLCLTLRRSF